MPKKILIVFAHPQLQTSRVQVTLRQAVQDIPGVIVRDLYQLYPDFYIDKELEQSLLVDIDLIVFQHPIYWYSSPSLLKEWMDQVLELGFAYGPGGDKLRGKDYWQVCSSGGRESVYQRQGANRFTLSELLRPFEATAYLCGWKTFQPLLIHGVNNLSDQEIKDYAKEYRHVLMHYQETGLMNRQTFDTSAAEVLT